MYQNIWIKFINNKRIKKKIVVHITISYSYPAKSETHNMLGNNVEQDVTRIFLKPLNVFIGNKEQRNIGKMIKVKGNYNIE